MLAVSSSYHHRRSRTNITCVVSSTPLPENHIAQTQRTHYTTPDTTTYFHILHKTVKSSLSISHHARFVWTSRYLPNFTNERSRRRSGMLMLKQHTAIMSLCIRYVYGSMAVCDSMHCWHWFVWLRGRVVVALAHRIGVLWCVFLVVRLSALCCWSYVWCVCVTMSMI